jgi:hypothetical protein
VTDDTVASLLGDNPLTGNKIGVSDPVQPSLLSNSSPHTLLNFAHNPSGVAGFGSNVSDLTGVSPKANVTQLDPDFKSRLVKFQQAAREAGVETNIISGYRNNDQQAKLYANYKAKQSGSALPYPEEGSGGIAAPPGMSYHNSGNAVDMYAVDPTKQDWLIKNAPAYGIYPGANFGDRGHFQISGANPSGDHAGSAASSSGQTTDQGSQTPPALEEGSGEATPNGSSSMHGLYTMALLQNLYPQHKFTPIEYDPFAVQPRGIKT